MNYYGFSNTYGIGTIDEDGQRIGMLHVFGSRSLRQRWEDQNSDCNEAITASEARRILRRMVKDTTGDDVRYMGIEDLLRVAYVSNCNVW